MWVYILIPTLLAFGLGWGFSAEHARKKHWRG
jgi:hypothetical protein